MTRRIAAFIRHAAYHQMAGAPSALQPFALRAEGQAQAQASAQTMHQFLQAKGWVLHHVVHTSSSLRAWQTANIFTDALKSLFNAPPVIKSDDALTERSVGCVANLTQAQIEQVVQDDPRFEPLPNGWKADSHFTLPFQGAESLMASGERVAQYMISQMQAMQLGEAVTVQLFFGHGAAFRHAAYHFGILSMDDIKRLSMYHAQPIYLEYAEETGWQHIGGEWKIRAVQEGYTD